VLCAGFQFFFFVLMVFPWPRFSRGVVFSFLFFVLIDRLPEPGKGWLPMRFNGFSHDTNIFFFCLLFLLLWVDDAMASLLYFLLPGVETRPAIPFLCPFPLFFFSRCCRSLLTLCLAPLLVFRHTHPSPSCGKVSRSGARHWPLSYALL